MGDLPKRTTCSTMLVSDHKRSIEEISHSNSKNDNGDRDYNNISINNNDNNQERLSHQNTCKIKNEGLIKQVPCRYCGELFGAGCGLSVHENRWCSKNPNIKKRKTIEETKTTSDDVVRGPGRPRTTPRSATVSKPASRTGTGDVVAVRRGPGRPRSTPRSATGSLTQGNMAAGISNDMSATTTTAMNMA